MLIYYVGNILEAFSNQTRVKIIVCLSKKEKNVTEIIENCELSQSAVSQHLMKLKKEGIISCQKKGREQIYKVNDPEVKKIATKIYKLIKKENKNGQ